MNGIKVKEINGNKSLTHSFPIQLFYNPRKRVEKGCIGSEWVKEICDKYDGAEDLLKTINEKIEDICSYEKSSVEEVILF